MLKEKSEPKVYRIKGLWKFVIRDADTGKILSVKEYQNIVTNVGSDKFSETIVNPNELKGGSGRKTPFIVLGVNNSTPSTLDTSLTEPITASVKEAEVTHPNSFETKYYARYFPEDANGHTYREAGVYDWVPGSDWTEGILLNHLIIDDFAKTSDKLLDVYITIKFYPG